MSHLTCSRPRSDVHPGIPAMEDVREIPAVCAKTNQLPPRLRLTLGDRDDRFLSALAVLTAYLLAEALLLHIALPGDRLLLLAPASWFHLNTGDNIFPTLPRRFSSARLGSRRVRLHADDGHRTCATEGFSPPPLSRLSLTFRDASTNVRPQVPPWSNCQDSVHDLSHDQPAIPRHPATLRREHKDFLRPDRKSVV